MRAFGICMAAFNLFMCGAWADHVVKTGVIDSGPIASLTALACSLFIIWLSPARRR